LKTLFIYKWIQTSRYVRKTGGAIIEVFDKERIWLESSEVVIPVRLPFRPLFEEYKSFDEGRLPSFSSPLMEKYMRQNPKKNYWSIINLFVFFSFFILLRGYTFKNCHEIFT
jgi:hypothetical protein